MKFFKKYDKKQLIKFMSIVTAITLAIVYYLFSINTVSISSADSTDSRNIIIDVRTEKEYQQGHLGNAINIPYEEIEVKIKEYVKSKHDKIILYCHSGMKSGIALGILKKNGYFNVINAGSYAILKKQENE